MIPEERERLIAHGLQELAAVVVFERYMAQKVPAAADRLRHISMLTASEIVRVLLGHRGPR